MRRIVIASDHAGYALKAQIQQMIRDVAWEDLGPINENRVDYPDFAELVAAKVTSGEAELGVLVCGSGIGMSIAANKTRGIRAAVVENPVAARLAREHNDANVLCLGSRFLAPEYAAEICMAFVSASFSGDARHQQRVRKIEALESKGK